MSSSSLHSTLDDLRSVSRTLRAAIGSVSMEQRARYKELLTQLVALEQRVEEGEEDGDTGIAADTLLGHFRRFAAHLEQDTHVAA